MSLCPSNALVITWDRLHELEWAGDKGVKGERPVDVANGDAIKHGQALWSPVALRGKGELRGWEDERDIMEGGRNSVPHQIEPYVSRGMKREGKSSPCENEDEGLKETLPTPSPPPPTHT